MIIIIINDLGRWMDREWHLEDVLLDVVEIKGDHLRKTKPNKVSR